ncbi:fibronectin type III domain-containing protein [Kibdelosporangium philippinense]|uniref:Fibronectin type III domain-containing protein n=1 Tax=Kibdelosporangium philippinense TaxID=211113 RepID=A0ABS8Z6L6_9PSEU|nr:fibronectin type III domain-containing protein [Kibdelosporangium philippinense]MCE7002694.1 fibronectin type III domain-containing protein [Kibdelosporangium philippinense]
MIKKLVVVSLVVLAGCSASPTGDAPNLTATLRTPITIDLAWKAPDTAAAGQVVEYANEEKGEYTILDFLPLTQTTYQHKDLIPQTKFFYRVRPYYGTASPEIALILPPGDITGTESEEGMQASTRPGPPARATTRDAQGAPTDFTVTMLHANGVKLTWTDHTTDEDGFLVELKADGKPDFVNVAMADPNVNTFGLITQPDEKKATYRVRPYKFGAPTNIAKQTTGAA